jgi:hypothetical protein
LKQWKDAGIMSFYLTDRFDEQPVFPDEAPGILAVSPKEKLTTTWGSIRNQ